MKNFYVRLLSLLAILFIAPQVYAYVFNVNGGGGGSGGVGGTSLGSTCPSCTATPTTSGQKSGLEPPLYKTIYYDNKMTNTRAVTNFDYFSAKINPCINDPYSYGAGAANAVEPLEDINSQPPSGSSTPPDECTVTNLVQCNGVPCTSTSQTITTAVAAVCPAGYVQVGSFNMQPEVKYNATSITENSPTDIPNMQTYQSLVSKGFQCSASSYPNDLQSACINAPAQGVATAIFDYGIHTPVPNPTGAAGVVEFDHLEYHNSSTNNACYTGNSNCSGTPDTACYLGWAANSPTYGTSSSSASIQMVTGPNGVQPNDIMSTYAFFYYGNISCTLPSGPYFTNNMAPSSFVCARLKSQYNQINP